MNIIMIGYSVWNNDVKQIGETDKAVHLEVEGDKRFVDFVGARAWFPKSGLIIEHYTQDDGPDFQIVQIKPWLRRKLNKYQSRVVGFGF